MKGKSEKQPPPNCQTIIMNHIEGVYTSHDFYIFCSQGSLKVPKMEFFIKAHIWGLKFYKNAKLSFIKKKGRFL